MQRNSSSFNAPRLAYCLVALATMVAFRTASAGLVLNIDTTNKNFYCTGSDTGLAHQFNPDPDPDPFGPIMNMTSSVQFIHYFATDALSASGAIAPSITNLFTGAGRGEFNSLDAVNNGYGSDYVFMQFVSYSSNITTLTGAGSSAALSYAGVPAGIMSGFESLIGDTLVLTEGTGYSSIVVQAVPEPSTYCMALAGLACGGYSMFRRRRAH